MKRVITLIAAVAIMASMIAVPAYACTPKLQIPKVNIPTIKPKIELNLSEDFWSNYFKENPLNIEFGGK